MKNIVLPFAGALLIGFCAYAQQDTTTNREKDSSREKKRSQVDGRRDQSTEEARRSGNVHEQSQQPKHEMVIIQASEIPASLRETLQDPKYAGWENAIIYHNTRTDEYLVSPRPHRFTGEGKEIGYGTSSTGNRPGGHSQYGKRPDEEKKTGNGTTDHTNATDNDGANDADRDNQDSSRQGTPTPRATERQPSNAFRKDSTSTPVETENMPAEGMVLVQGQEIPSALKETLRDSNYTGWERGKLYRNEVTGEYILIMGSSDNGNDEQRSYRFDKNGKVLRDGKMNGRSKE